MDAIDGECTRFQDWVVSKRSWIFGTLLVFYLLAFNGQWRVGRGIGLGLYDGVVRRADEATLLLRGPRVAARKS